MVKVGHLPTNLNIEQTDPVMKFDLKKIFFYRLTMFILFYAIFQIVIILQKPFIHSEFVYVFYGCMLVHTLAYVMAYVTRRTQDWLLYLIDIGLIYFLFYHQPQYTAFYLVYLSIVLFLSGLEFDYKKSIVLTFMTSAALSYINLKSVRWTGVQNLLNLSLFNITFILVTVISYQFKAEVTSLKDSLMKSALKLKAKIDLNQLLIEKIPVGLTALNSKGDILFTNETLTHQYQVFENDLKSMVQEFTDQQQTNIKMYNSQLLEKRFYNIDQASYFDHELQDQIKVHLIKDVTDLVRLQEDIKQKEKMAAVGQLAAGIAHEIRNPLAGISGSIELLSRENQNPDDQKLMRIIIKEIDRLNNLITEFLSYSRPEKTPDQLVDLALILDEVMQNIKYDPNTVPGVVYDIHLSRMMVLGYSDKLKQAFINIIVNAIQAMKEVPFKKLSVTLSATTEKVTVTIKDTGCGMSEAVSKRIFEPFFTTKSKGTGLGMAITHKILDAHAAQIEVNSEVGQGTEFRIIFNKA